MSRRNPEVEIQFGGRTRRLKYDFNARAEMEDRGAKFESNFPRLKALRLTLWAGLLAETLDSEGRPTLADPEHPERLHTLSLIEVGDIIDSMSKAEVDAIAEAIAKASEKAAPPATANPTPATEPLEPSKN